MSATSVRPSPQNEETVTHMATSRRHSKIRAIRVTTAASDQPPSQAETRWQDTLEALQDAETGQTYSGEAVHAWLSTWGTAGERKTPSAML